MMFTKDWQKTIEDIFKIEGIEKIELVLFPSGTWLLRPILKK